MRDSNIKVFLDKWNLVPGAPWQESLESAMNQSATCGICISNSGIGSWQNEEMRVFLEKRVRDNTIRVIPILLPGTNEEMVKSLPSFLSRLHRVDFRAGTASTDGFRNLIAGISGISPEEVKLPLITEQPNETNKICVVISGPSSVGKDVILGRLIEKSRKKVFFLNCLKSIQQDQVEN